MDDAPGGVRQTEREKVRQKPQVPEVPGAEQGLLQVVEESGIACRTPCIGDPNEGHEHNGGEHDQGNAEAREPVAYEQASAFAIERTRHQVSGDHEEERHPVVSDDLQEYVTHLQKAVAAILNEFPRAPAEVAQGR